MGKCKTCKYKRSVDDWSVLDSFVSAIRWDELRCGNFKSSHYGSGKMNYDTCLKFEKNKY